MKQTIGHKLSMMEVEEGDELLTGDNPTSNATIENCINNSKINITRLLVICLAMGNAADAVEIMCVGFIMTEIKEITNTQKEFLSAAVFIGMLLGGILGGYLSDSIGRKPALQLSLLINSISGLASCFSPNVTFLIASRIVAGIGIGGSVPVVFGLGAELIPSLIRGRYLSVIASFWMVGAIFTALSAWIMLGNDQYGHKILPEFITWRHFAFVCATPALLALFFATYVLPESPRFLMRKGRIEEAAIVLSYLTSLEIKSESLIPHKKSILKQSETNETMDRKSGPMLVLEILFGPSLFWTTIVSMIIWFSLSFGSYGLSTWITTLFIDVGVSNPFEDAFIFALANLPGNLITMFLLDIYGRKLLLFCGMCLAAVSALGFALDTSNKMVVVICAFLFNAFSVIGWNALSCLSVEYFPTIVRTSGMGVLAAAGRLGAITAQFVNGSLEKNIPLLLIVTSGCTALGGLSSYLLPSDKVGVNLPEYINSNTDQTSLQYDNKYSVINNSSVDVNPIGDDVL